MPDYLLPVVAEEQKMLWSSFLQREVVVDLYALKHIALSDNPDLLLINDGQDLPKMNFKNLLHQLLLSNQIKPLVCVGIHAGGNRLQEYGTAKTLDYEGRGNKSMAYQQFIIEELLPFVHVYYGIESFRKKGIAGFSLGGLSAFDTVWNHPQIFSIVGVFSGSLWWRIKNLGDGYNDDTDRIIHQQVRKGEYYPCLRFYFTTGSLDETADRNGNGIIDSIDDTLDLIKELENKGYTTAYDIKYINYEDGRHDVATGVKPCHSFCYGDGEGNIRLL